MVVIRPSKSTDANTLEKLAIEFQNYLIPLDPLKRLRLTPDYGKKYLQMCYKEIRQKLGIFYVAESGGEIVGYIVGVIVKQSSDELMGHKPANFGRITELFISEKYRNKGVGQKLMQKAEDYFSKHKCYYVMVEVFVPNTNAHQFYHRAGFNDRNTDLIKKL